MEGIILQRSEFLVFLNAVRAQALVGFDSQELFPQTEAEFRAAIYQGIEQLKQRGLLRLEGEINVLNADLLGMVMAMAYPQLAVLTTRDTPGLGQQLFLHYQAADVVVEHTLPAAGQHRLAVLPAAALVERLQAILPVAEDGMAPEASATMSMEVFLEVKAKAEAGQTEAAMTLLAAHGLVDGSARELVAALQSPVFGGMVALVQCQQGEITDGRNIALVQGAQTAWAIMPTTPGAPDFRVSTVTAAAVTDRLQQWVKELSAAPLPA